MFHDLNLADGITSISEQAGPEHVAPSQSLEGNLGIALNTLNTRDGQSTQPPPRRDPHRLNLNRGTFAAPTCATIAKATPETEPLATVFSMRAHSYSNPLHLPVHPSYAQPIHRSNAFPANFSPSLQMNNPPNPLTPPQEEALEFQNSDSQTLSRKLWSLALKLQSTDPDRVSFSPSDVPPNLPDEVDKSELPTWDEEDESDESDEFDVWGEPDLGPNVEEEPKWLVALRKRRESRAKMLARARASGSSRRM